MKRKSEKKRNNVNVIEQLIDWADIDLAHHRTELPQIP